MNHGVATREDGERRECGEELVRLPHLLGGDAECKASRPHKFISSQCESLLLARDQRVRPNGPKRSNLLTEFGGVLRQPASHLLVRAAEQLKRARPNQFEVGRKARGRNARCPCAIVCDKIRKRHIGLMPDCGKHRQVGRCDRAQEHLAVEGCKVVARSTTTCEQDHARGRSVPRAHLTGRMEICATDGVSELLWRARTLDRRVDEQEPSLWRRNAKHAHNIVQHRARTRGNDCNPLRRNRNRSLPRRIEEALRLEPAAERLQLLRQQSDPTRRIRVCATS